MAVSAKIVLTIGGVGVGEFNGVLVGKDVTVTSGVSVGVISPQNVNKPGMLDQPEKSSTRSLNVRLHSSPSLHTGHVTIKLITAN